MARGVCLSHGNLVANCAAIVDAYGLNSENRGVSWLPLHHDMGLVGHVLVPMWLGGTSSLMNPLHFLQRPLNWLRLVTDQSATITSAPNFACEMCVNAAAGDCSGIDLSALETLVCGGEPILPGTVRGFINKFAPYGLSPSAFAPSYGLAEATLLVTNGRTKNGPQFRVQPGGTNTEVTDLGPPVGGVELSIQDAEGRHLAEGEIGEIVVAGASVGSAIDGGPTRPVKTGDLGFFAEGCLSVVGRIKELIIIRGQNFFPAPIEEVAMRAHPAVVSGGVVAVGVSRNGTEELVVVFEARRQQIKEDDELIERLIGESIARAIGVTPAWVVSVAFPMLPRTPSGKLQRRAISELIAELPVGDKAALRDRLGRGA